MCCKLSASGPFTISFEFDESGVRAATSVSDEGLTMWLMVLMHRFLNPSDALYHGKVWERLRRQFGDEMPAESAGLIVACIERRNMSAIGISINGEGYTPERVYGAIAEGEYFGQSAAHRDLLRDPARVPSMAGLFPREFSRYTTESVALVSLLFNAVMAVERSEKYRGLHGAASALADRCVYCPSANGRFTSKEHVFPEALGNDEIVLPLGFVCDRCNNQTLSSLDQTLVQFEPIAHQRVWYVPYTKQEKLPEAKFRNASIRKTRPNYVLINSAEDVFKVEEVRPDGWTRFSFHLVGKKFDPVLLSRAYYKIALGLVALDMGQEYACDGRFDPARAFVLDGRDFANNLLLCGKVWPHPRARAQYVVLNEGVPFAIDLFGVVALFNLEEHPPCVLNDALVQAHFSSFPLHR